MIGTGDRHRATIWFTTARHDGSDIVTNGSDFRHHSGDLATTVIAGHGARVLWWGRGVLDRMPCHQRLALSL